jgi:hypothetical protein
MEIIERLFLELVTLELRKGAGLADAASEAKFRMSQDMPSFLASLAEVKAAGEPKPAKAKKGKAEKVEPEAEIVDIDASLEPTAE